MYNLIVDTGDSPMHQQDVGYKLFGLGYSPLVRNYNYAERKYLIGSEGKKKREVQKDLEKVTASLDHPKNTLALVESHQQRVKEYYLFLEPERSGIVVMSGGLTCPKTIDYTVQLCIESSHIATKEAVSLAYQKIKQHAKDGKYTNDSFFEAVQDMVLEEDPFTSDLGASLYIPLHNRLFHAHKNKEITKEEENLFQKIRRYGERQGWFKGSF